MRTRFLPPEEWHRVKGLEVSALLPHVAPHNIALIVVEDDAGEIIGSLACLQVTHLEGVWVKPERRNGVVVRALLRQAYELAKCRAEEFVIGGAADGDGAMDGYIGRLGGAALPLKFYALSVKGV